MNHNTSVIQICLVCYMVRQCVVFDNLFFLVQPIFFSKYNEDSRQIDTTQIFLVNVETVHAFVPKITPK